MFAIQPKFFPRLSNCYFLFNNDNNLITARTRTTWSVFFLKYVIICSVQLLRRTTLLSFVPSDKKVGQIRITQKSFRTLSKPKYFYLGKALKKLKLHSRRNLQQLIFGEYYLLFGSESFFFLPRLLPQGAQNKIRETVNLPVVLWVWNFVSVLPRKGQMFGSFDRMGPEECVWTCGEGIKRKVENLDCGRFHVVWLTFTKYC
jgi:hypothetical protein